MTPELFAYAKQPLPRKQLVCGITPHPLENEDLRQCYPLLTKRCNAQCPYCIEPEVHTGGFMSEDTFIRVMEHFKALDMQILYLHGGEPTIHPQVVHFATLAKEYGFMVNMFTNGLRMDVLRELDGIVDEIRFSYEPGREYMFQKQDDWASRVKFYIMGTVESYPTEDDLMTVVHRALDLGMGVKVRTLNPVNDYAYRHQFVPYLHDKVLAMPTSELFCDGNKLAYWLPGVDNVVVRLGNLQLNPGHKKFSASPEGEIRDRFVHSDQDTIQLIPEIEELRNQFEPLRQFMMNI